MYARTTSLNSLTQQMNGIGLVTLVPDLAYIDVRAVAGVHNLYGGIGGLGTIGASCHGRRFDAGQRAQPGAATAPDLTRNDEVQTNSFGISPYLLQSSSATGEPASSAIRSTPRHPTS